MTPTPMNLEKHPVVPREEWLVARKELLAWEKAFVKTMDEISQKRRELPWVRVEADYAFEGPGGKVTLADLFRGRSQLVVYHFMYGPGWKEGCSGCSFLSDYIDGARLHFEHHDVAFAAVSRAPWAELQDFRKRMGWTFPWVSSFGSNFNYDFGVSFTPEQLASGSVVYNYAETSDAIEELPGLSVFVRRPSGEIFHTYSAYARGLDLLLGAHMILDLTPKGRDEKSTMDWVRHHDRYESAEARDGECGCH